MRFQAKYAGQFRNVRIPDSLWKLWEVAVDDPKGEVRDMLKDCEETDGLSASQAATSFITGWLQVMVRKGRDY